MEENGIEMQTIRPERNYGIEALRIVSMVMVATLHVLLRGGILGLTEAMQPKLSGPTSQYMTAWFLEIAAYCAVDCYALISGYAGAAARYRYTSFAVLWLRVVFYSLGITALFAVFSSEPVDSAVWDRSLFPVTRNTYWYFTSYAGLFVLMPALNAAIRTLGKKRLAALAVGMMTAFSLVPFFTGREPFGFGGGYSVWWLMVLYIVGGYIRLYGLFPKKGAAWMFLGYLVMVCLTWGYKIGCAAGVLRGKYDAVNYISPTIVGAGLFLFLAFERLRFSKTAQKAVAFFAPLSFSVYLIHVHPMIWDRLMHNRFSVFGLYSPLRLAASVLGTAAAIFIVCSLIDFFREKLFAALRIRERLSRLEEKARRRVTRSRERCA